MPGIRAGKLNVQEGAVEWTCPATLYHATVLRSVFGDRLVLDADVEEWGSLEVEAEQIRLAIKDVPPSEGGTLRPFQKTGANWLWHDSSILADDMGLGKTVQALAALEALAPYAVGFDALVVTTSSMKYQWATEAAKWAPSWNPVVIDGDAPKRVKAILDAPAGTLFIINWESLRKHTKLAGYGSVTLTPSEKEVGELNRRRLYTVIADEAHRAKDPNSKQTRALWAVGSDALYRWALTGTPVANEPNDLWSLLYWMDPVMFPSRSAFQDRYVFGVETQWGFEPMGWRAETKAELFRFVDRFLLRRSKEEVLKDLPAKTYERRLLDLKPSQQKAYKAMKKELMARIDDELLLATDPLTKLQRLSQIASATPVVQEGEVIALKAPSNKVDAVVEIAQETSESLVVFAASRKLIDLTEQELHKAGITTVRITGTESAELRQVHVQQFQEGLVRVALCTFAAGSEGITLTRASTMVMMQRPWSLVQSRQAEDRIHRIGQESDKVLIIDLVSKGTVDIEVHKALVEKQETLESVVRDRERLEAML